MTTTTYTNGRLCNQIIRNLAVSFVAEKFNLNVNYSNNILISELGINLFCGENIYDDEIIINDVNYFDILNGTELKSNLNPNYDYFQTKEIMKLIHNYLHSEIIKNNIIEKNLFKDRYNNNNDLFIHIRLGDVAHYNPGINYYINTMDKVNTINEGYDNIFISTDDINHELISELLNIYQQSQIIDLNELNTLQFGSTCKNVILSHGSFSAIIGHLSFFSNIYYPEYDENKIWYGDMFSIEGWNKCSTQ